jgi:hypothetical protein
MKKSAGDMGVMLTKNSQHHRWFSRDLYSGIVYDCRKRQRMKAVEKPAGGR